MSTKKQASLLSKLRNNVQEDSRPIPPPPVQVFPEHRAPVDAPAKPALQSPGTQRITVTFAFQPEDTHRIESLKMWCLSQSNDCNSSQIVRAALLLAPRDHTFIDALQTVKSTDGRRLRKTRNAAIQ